MQSNSDLIKKESDEIKKELNSLRKEDALRKKELKKVKEENVKLNKELAKVQSDKDIFVANTKAEEKVIKMKENTKLFNRIIEKQIEDGEVINVDIKRYKDKEAEECEDKKIFYFWTKRSTKFTIK